jgi:hypothetical protein
MVLRLERQLKNSLTLPQTPEGDMEEAMGSVRKCQAIFELATLTTHATYKELDILAASLYCLIRSAS